MKTSPAARGRGIRAARSPNPPRRALLLGALATCVLVAGTAAAQPPAGMGEAHDMAARPLMVGDLPTGTVTVRVGRGSLSNLAVGVDVVATLTAPDGKRSQRTERTQADGRATFSALPPGAEFHAQAIVDGETLQTAAFAIPAEGGARLMLVSSSKRAGAAEAESEDAPAAQAVPTAEGTPPNPHTGAHTGTTAELSIGALAGKVAPKQGLAPGTLELRLVGANGAAIPGQEVKLGRAAKTASGVAWLSSTTDENGTVRLQEPETGAASEYLAVVERDGLWLGSERFHMPTERGAAGELRVPDRTSDASVLQVSSSSKILIDLREDAIEVMENLVLENTSDKIFQADHGGLAIPLPAEANEVGAIEGGSHLDLREPSTVVLPGAIPPVRPDQVPVQARFGFFVPTAGQRSITLRQPMPFGLQNPVVMVPHPGRLSLSAAGLQAMATQPDDRGETVSVFQLASVPRNGVLSITVSGLPARGTLGKSLAGLVAGVLVLAAALGLRQPKGKNRPDATPLSRRREQLMAELVEVERARRTGGLDDAPLTQKRAELLAAIETVDRELAGDAVADARGPA